MYKDLKNLFGEDTPTVRLFVSKLKNLSEEEQHFYYRAALSAAFFDWVNLPKRYQLFITHLFAHDRQKTLDYLLRSTVLGTLRFESLDPTLLRQVISLLEGKQENGDMPSFPKLGFSFLLAFHVDYSLKYFSALLRESKLQEDDYWHLLERVRHDNERGKLPGW